MIRKLLKLWTRILGTVRDESRDSELQTEIEEHVRLLTERYRRQGMTTETAILIETLVADGAAVLMISSELPEMVAVCDRAYVMRDKRIAGELQRSELSEENILKLAMAHE